MLENAIVYILVEEDKTVEASEPVRRSGERGLEDIGGGFSAVKDRVVGEIRKRVPVSADVLKQQVSGLLQVVTYAFDQAQQRSDGLELEEVDLTIEINSEGQISILGNTGKVGNRGAIALKFKRARS